MCCAAAAEAESAEHRAAAEALRRDNEALRTEAAEAAAAQRGLEENGRMQAEEAYQQVNPKPYTLNLPLRRSTPS